jgi:hypothetical protein
LPLRLTQQQWRSLLWWFARGMPSALIASETRLERKRVLRALTVVRQAMTRSVPPNTTPAPHAAGDHSRTAERFTRSVKTRFPAFGLYTARGRVWAEVMPDADALELHRLLRDRESRRSVAERFSRRYSAVAYRGRLFRIGRAGSDDAPFGQIEAFWSYLHRQLRSKGGIRRERLGLYLAEYSWRYNRRIPPAEQVREFLKLIRGRPAEWRQ